MQKACHHNEIHIKQQLRIKPVSMRKVRTRLVHLEGACASKMHQNSAFKQVIVVPGVPTPDTEYKMISNKAFDDLAHAITRLLPEGVSRLQTDLESSIKAALQTGLAKMNLVTREEFDIQVALLERSREKLEHLEKQLAVLIEQQNSKQ